MRYSGLHCVHMRVPSLEIWSSKALHRRINCSSKRKIQSGFRFELDHCRAITQYAERMQRREKAPDCWRRVMLQMFCQMHETQRAYFDTRKVVRTYMFSVTRRASEMGRQHDFPICCCYSISISFGGHISFAHRLPTNKFEIHELIKCSSRRTFSCVCLRLMFFLLSFSLPVSVNISPFNLHRKQFAPD